MWSAYFNRNQCKLKVNDLSARTNTTKKLVPIYFQVKKITGIMVQIKSAS